MDQDTSKQLGNVIKIDETEVQKHVSEIVRGTVEETLADLAGRGSPGGAEVNQAMTLRNRGVPGMEAA